MCIYIYIYMYIYIYIYIYIFIWHAERIESASILTVLFLLVTSMNTKPWSTFYSV